MPSKIKADGAIEAGARSYAVRETEAPKTELERCKSKVLSSSEEIMW